MIVAPACGGHINTAIRSNSSRAVYHISTGCMTSRCLLQVSGYVKAVSSVGVFVVLARNADARVKMGHLSDSFVKDPKQTFPEGKLVEGRVITSVNGRCWLQCVTQALYLTCQPISFAACVIAL